MGMPGTGGLSPQGREAEGVAAALAGKGADPRGLRVKVIPFILL